MRVFEQSRGAARESKIKSKAVLLTGEVPWKVVGTEVRITRARRHFCKYSVTRFLGRHPGWMNFAVDGRLIALDCDVELASITYEKHRGQSANQFTRQALVTGLGLLLDTY